MRRLARALVLAVLTAAAAILIGIAVAVLPPWWAFRILGNRVPADDEPGGGWQW